MKKEVIIIFYSERIDKTWIMSSDEFILESNQNKKGKNVGKRSIWFNGVKTDKATNQKIEYPKAKFDKYLSTDFSRFKK